MSFLVSGGNFGDMEELVGTISMKKRVVLRKLPVFTFMAWAGFLLLAYLEWEMLFVEGYGADKVTVGAGIATLVLAYFAFRGAIWKIEFNDWSGKVRTLFTRRKFQLQDISTVRLNKIGRKEEEAKDWIYFASLCDREGHLIVEIDSVSEDFFQALFHLYRYGVHMDVESGPADFKTFFRIMDRRLENTVNGAGANAMQPYQLTNIQHGEINYSANATEEMNGGYSKEESYSQIGNYEAEPEPVRFNAFQKRLFQLVGVTMIPLVLFYMYHKLQEDIQLYTRFYGAMFFCILALDVLIVLVGAVYWRHKVLRNSKVYRAWLASFSNRKHGRYAIPHFEFLDDNGKMHACKGAEDMKVRIGEESAAKAGGYLIWYAPQYQDTVYYGREKPCKIVSVWFLMIIAAGFLGIAAMLILT